MSNLTLSQVAQLPIDGWVEPGFEANVARIESIAKKAPKTGFWWKVHLEDVNGTRGSLSMFTAPKCAVGDTLRVTGKGIKRGDYNGQLQISLTKDSVLEVVTGATKVQAAAHGAVAQAQNAALINGAQVGGAVKSVFEAYTRHLTPEQLGLLRTPSFWQDIHNAASDYVRVCQLIESGRLADPVKVRAAQGSKPQAQPRQSTVEQELGAEPDVPF